MQSRFSLFTAIVAGCLSAAAQPAAAATNIYLSTSSPSIPGESQASGYVGQIVLKSYTQSVENTVGTSATGGGSAGKLSCGAIILTKAVDKASPLLIKAVMIGEHISDAVISFVDTTGQGGGAGGGGAHGRNDYTVTLKNAVVTSVTQNDSSPNELTETVNLVAESFTVEYVPYGNNGKAGTSESFTVDCTGQKAT